jgi:galactokinase
MNMQWIAFQNFKQSQDLISAINTLSIHLKLKLLNVNDEERIQAVEKAKTVLAAFLKTLNTVVDRIEQTKSEPLTGVEPRLHQLANNLVTAKQKQSQFRSVLFNTPPDRIEKMLNSDQVEEQKELINSLRELRTFLEENFHEDTVQIIGEF